MKKPITKEDVKVGDVLTTTISRWRGEPETVIAVSDIGVSFFKIGEQYVWVEYKYLKPYKPKK